METKIWSMQSDLKHSLNTESDVIKCWPLTCLDASHIAYATLHTFQLMSNLLNGHFELLYTTLFMPGENSIIIKTIHRISFPTTCCKSTKNVLT